MDMDEITSARAKAIKASIQPTSTAEMKALGETIFPFLDDPWREAFFGFLAENPNAGFHRATTNDGIEFLYCHEKNKGIWFVPKSAVGPLQAKGLQIMNDAVLGTRQ